MSRDTTAQSDVGKLPTEADGSFKRLPSTFRNTIEKGGKFEPEKGRYHLYVSYSCPWASRTLIVRKLKGLDEIISLTAVSPRMDEHGWPFAVIDPFPGADSDPNINAEHIKDIYLKVNPHYDGRFTVPILWDKKSQAIVNNESSEIIRIFNRAFNDLLPPEKARIDLYPEALRSDIDELNSWVYDSINNGVYQAGFASTQSAYERAVPILFQSLDRVESLLSKKPKEEERFLIANRLTEADVRLYVTLIRFDPVYYSHFKCNLTNIRTGYPNIHKWLRTLYWNYPAFSETTKFDHIKAGYYYSMTKINPHRIIPLGPIPNILPL